MFTRRLYILTLLSWLAHSSAALAQVNMTMPPADLCLGVTGAQSVPVGQTLILNTPAPPCLSVYGTLDLRDGAIIDTVHSHLGSLVKASSGTIRVANVAPVDPGQFRTGFVFEGRVEFEGAAKTSWSRLTTELPVGRTMITVEDATGWNIGDQIVIADTRDQDGSPTPEQFRIASVVGNSITLDHATIIEHPGSKDDLGILERYPPIANLTRSLVIRSMDPMGSRGHMMITTKATGYIRNVEVADMGRTTPEPLNTTTNVKGRYATHLHFTENPGFELVGNSIHDSLKWGITIHHTNGHIIRDNAIVRSLGTAIMTEDGTEADNLFDHNLVIDVSGPLGEDDSRGATGDWGWNGGNGAWAQGPRNNWTRNVIANARRDCFQIWGRSTPNEIVKEFRENECVASGKGLVVWFAGSSDADSLIDRLYEWHSQGECFYNYPSYRLIIQDITCRGDARVLNPDKFKSGISFGDYSATSVRVVRPVISNKTYGMWLPYGNASGGGTTLRETPVTGGLFGHNVYGIVTITPGGSYDPMFQVPFRSVLTGVHFRGNIRSDIYRWYQLGSGKNLIQLQQLDVINHNGTVGDNFRVFYTQSDPSFVMPSGDWWGSKHPGSPDYTGLTNTQMWMQFKAAFMGEVATCNVTRSGIVGFVCPLGMTPTPPPPVLSIQCGEDVSSSSAVPIGVSYEAPRIVGGAPPVVVACQPLSGSMFPLGMTQVSCSALDMAQQQASCRLNVSVVVPPPPPPPPPPSTTLIVTQEAASCRFDLVAIPPTAQTGWSAQFRRDGGTVIGLVDSTPPYARTVTLVPGTYKFFVTWTRTGTSGVTSESVQQTCPGR